MIIKTKNQVISIEEGILSCNAHLQEDDRGDCVVFNTALCNIRSFTIESVDKQSSPFSLFINQFYQKGMMSNFLWDWSISLRSKEEADLFHRIFTDILKGKRDFKQEECQLKESDKHPVSNVVSLNKE